MAQKTAKQREQLAKLLTGGTPVCEALETAGWSHAQAMKGWESVPDAVKRVLPKKAKTIMKLGAIDPETQEKLVRGRLAHNVISGKDGGSMSAKILGSDKRLSMWQPEMQQGVIILNAPASLLERKKELLEGDE